MPTKKVGKHDCGDELERTTALIREAGSERERELSDGLLKAWGVLTTLEMAGELGPEGKALIPELKADMLAALAEASRLLGGEL